LLGPAAPYKGNNTLRLCWGRSQPSGSRASRGSLARTRAGWR